MQGQVKDPTMRYMCNMVLTPALSQYVCLWQLIYALFIRVTYLLYYSYGCVSLAVTSYSMVALGFEVS